MARRYPTTKQVLLLAGVGAFIAGSLLMPGLPRLLAGKKFDFLDFFDEDEWEAFDKVRLRQKLKILHKQRVIRIYEVDGKIAVQITKKGNKKLLKYKLEDLEIPKPNKWDKKWRIVAYDIPKDKKNARDAMRLTLKRLGFLELQKSMYLYPYPCAEIVQFLREIYGIGDCVTYLTIGFLEDESAYKKYFDL